MASIAIAGSLDFSRQDPREFAGYLGAEVIEQGHVLLNGCRNEFDRLVAKSASETVLAHGGDPGRRIISYAATESQPVHGYGTVLRSRLPTWGLEFKRLQVPEPIEQADAVIVAGGGEGTLCAVNWARIAKKPVLPVTAFGGAGETAYHEEIKTFDQRYGDRIERLAYEALNQVPADLRKIAKDVVSLAARIAVSRHVFAIMAFSGDPKLQDAFDTIRGVCEDHGYECHRVDDTLVGARIIPEIFAQIRRSAFVVADLSGQTPNVYYELGFAQGLGKPCLVTACRGTALPFDVHDVPTIFWESQRQLKEGLERAIGMIATTQGR